MALKESIYYPPHTYYHKQTGEQVAGPMPLDPSFGDLISRPALHKALMHALSDEGVEVCCGERVVRYIETSSMGGVEVASGKVLLADLVVAADGIHSKSWTVVTGVEPKIYSSGMAVFRAAFPAHHALADPGLRERWAADEQGDKYAFFLGPASHGMMLFGKQVVSWVWVHKDNPETSSEIWSANLSAETALQQLDEAGDWAPDFRAVIAATPPKHIVDWRLLSRDLNREWVSPHGRVVQIGDAAHPFLPTSVNGGTQALEDAVSLPCCLRLAIDREGNDGATLGARVHNMLRFDRVKQVQLTGMKRLNSHRNVNWEEVKQDPSRIVTPIEEWIFTHNPEEYAIQRFGEFSQSLKDRRPPLVSSKQDCETAEVL